MSARYIGKTARQFATIAARYLKRSKTYREGGWGLGNTAGFCDCFENDHASEVADILEKRASKDPDLALHVLRHFADGDGIGNNNGIIDECRKVRLEHLRSELRAGRISYGELAELQSLSAYIAPDDVELLEAAGVPEKATQ